MLILSLSILGLLIIATLLVNVRIKIQTSSELIRNKKRIHTWWLICLICIPVFYVNGWALMLLVFVLIIWAAHEFSRMQNKQLNLLRGFFLLAIAIMYSLLLQQYPDVNYLFFVIPGLILPGFFRLPDRSNQRIILLFLFSITSIESILLISQQSVRSGYDSGLIILFLFFITALNDIFQYLCGKLFGKNPLATRISPGKTVEGAIGGIIVTGIVVATLLPLIINISWQAAILIGIVISVLGIAGDLSMSYMKRQANIKDTGSSMPGHGGLLDRIDSLTLTAPGFGLCLSVIS